jgi:peptide/nickel transport system substrate-binding protein
VAFDNLSYMRILMGVVGVLALLLAVAGTTAAADSPSSTLRLASSSDVDSLDPALAWLTSSWSLLQLSCTTLMDQPGKERPGSPAVVPGGAADFPRVSRDGRTYTFTIRRGLRFSNGNRITAANYAHALGRLRRLATGSPIGFFVEDVVSAHGRGRTLRVRLAKPRGDFVSRASLPLTCPVPLNLPADSAGIDLPLSSGPYTITSRSRGREIVLRPNRYYNGPHPARFASIVFTVTGTGRSLVQDVEAGRFDYTFGGLPGDLAADLIRKYGVGRGRLFSGRFLGISYIAFNLRGGVLGRDVALRRAVNFALDRPELLRAAEAMVTAFRTDQVLPLSIAGSVNARLYPISGANLQAARRLAGGRLRGRTLVLYTRAHPNALRSAAVIAYNLRQLGAEVEIKAFATPVLSEKLNTPGEPWDLAGPLIWLADSPDPYDFLGPLFASPRGPGSASVTGFANRDWFRRLRAADRLQGRARTEALGRLEVELMRDHVPVAPVWASKGLRLVSPRLGCVTFGAMGSLDLRKACLRQ